MKRKLSIAIALVGAPEIIFLDEPCTGLDPKNKRNLWNVLTRKGFRENRALVVTTHSMEEADVLCDRIGSWSLTKLQFMSKKFAYHRHTITTLRQTRPF